MSFSMKDLASDMISIMILIIGLTLAFVTMFLAIITVISANRKTIAMMMAFGYPPNDCRKAILSGYRLFSYIGFAIGTVYQYILLCVMVNIVFANFENMPEYEFNFKAMLISLVTFAAFYEILIHFYSETVKRISLKSSIYIFYTTWNCYFRKIITISKSVRIYKFNFCWNSYTF